MSSIHYGRSRAACGRMIHRLTDDRSLVTCGACKNTLQYATEWFTTNPSEIPKQRKSPTHQKRKGARP